MEKKFMWGVVVPGILIILLVFLSGSGIGYNVEESFVNSLDKNSIISEKYSNEKLLVKEIKIRNDFFLPRKIELTRTIACLSEQELDIRGATSFQTVYESADNPLFRDGFYDDTGVDIAPYESKTVKIYIKPSKFYPSVEGENITDQYSEINSITWLESDDYVDCWNYREADVVKEIPLN